MTVPIDIFATSPAQPYEELRGKIQTGDLLLYSGPQIFSRLIKWATHSPWSHSAFAVKLDDIDRVMVVECVNGGAGVRILSLSSVINGSGSHQKPYNGRLLVARHQGFSSAANKTSLRAMSEFATARLGAPYGAGEILKIALRIVMGWLNFRLPKLLQPDDEYICSEFVAACFEELPIQFGWDSLGFLAPSDIAADPMVVPIGVIKTLTR